METTCPTSLLPWRRNESQLEAARDQESSTSQPPNTTYNASFVEATTGVDLEAQFPVYLRPTVTVVCALILAVGVLGNLLVPVVVWRTKDLRSSTNLFLVNLSVADLLVLLVCMPPVLVEVHGRPDVWQLGPAMCKLVPFVELTVAHASVLTILAISFERYYAICQPLRAGYTCTRMRALAVCLGVWLAAIISTSPMLVIAEYTHVTYYDGSDVPACMTQAQTFWSMCYFLSAISIFFFVPFVVLLALYVVIACHLVADPGTAANPHLRSRKQVVAMLAAVVLVFFVCLLPFRVLTLYIVLASSEDLQNLPVGAYYNLLYSSRVMLYLNSAANPILYNVMSSKFRDAFLRLILGLAAKGPRRHLSRQSTFTTTTTTTTSGSSSFSSTGSALFKMKFSGGNVGGGNHNNNGLARGRGRRQRSVDEVLLNMASTSGIVQSGGRGTHKAVVFARANSVV